MVEKEREPIVDDCEYEQFRIRYGTILFLRNPYSQSSDETRVTIYTPNKKRVFLQTSPKGAYFYAVINGQKKLLGYIDSGYVMLPIIATIVEREMEFEIFIHL